MQLLMTFCLTGRWRVGQLMPELPMSLELPKYGDFRVSPLAGWQETLVVEAQTAVMDTDQILEASDVFGRPSLACPDIYMLRDGATRIGAAMSFAIGSAFAVSSADLEDFPNNYVAETTEDQYLLDRFGIDAARLPLMASTAVEVTDHYPVDANLIGALARRGAVTVYCEALRMERSVGQFRELWRTLEFAFQAHGAQLVDLLVVFPPVAELGFDRKELEALRTLRGKVSHAASRSGSAELAESESAVIRQLGRLWCLVDRVLLTKKEASQSLDVDELRPLRAFIDCDGTMQLSPTICDPKKWWEEHGVSSAARFRGPERQT
jgi:hypothetical protein